MGFGRAGGRAGAGGTFYGAQANIFGLGNAFEPRKNVEESAHVGGFFLDPHDFADIGMRADGSGDFVFRERVELIQEKNSSGRIVAAAAFGAKFVANFSTGDENGVRVADFLVGNNGLEMRKRELLDG